MVKGDGLDSLSLLSPIPIISYSYVYLVIGHPTYMTTEGRNSTEAPVLPFLIHKVYFQDDESFFWFLPKTKDSLA